MGWCSVNPGNVPYPEVAALWRGTAASMVNLNPSNYVNSNAFSTNGQQQVGYGQTAGNNFNALVWSGTAASVGNLQTLLPAAPVGTWTSSFADSIDSIGNIFGTANSIDATGTTYSYAVEWTASAVPEPSSVLMIGPVLTSLLLRRRR